MGSWEGWDPPEGTQGWSDWHWWRVPVGKVLELIILSEKPLGYSGHFTKGRMGPCYGEGCKLCREGIGAQLRYIVGAVEVGTRRVGMWDMGRSVAMEVRDLAAGRGAVRGLCLDVSHYSRARQSRTELEVIACEVPGWVAGLECPDIRRALVETWRKGGFEIPEGYERDPDRPVPKNRVASKIASSLQGR